MGLNLKILLLTIAALSVGPALVQAVDQGDISGRWSTEKACQWYQEMGAIKGCNYLPRSAVNMTEMWQASTFDPKTENGSCSPGKILSGSGIARAVFQARISHPGDLQMAI